MRVPTIYLETTIFNFPFADDAPQYKAEARQLFTEIKAGKFKPFTSEYVLDELGETKDLEKLKEMKVSDILDVIGPLGTTFEQVSGFRYQVSGIRYQKCLLVSGGCGFAPLNFLYNHLRRGDVPIANSSSDYQLSIEKDAWIHGGKNADEVSFATNNTKITICTDDGSIGERGYVTEAVKSAINKIKYDIVFSCGPIPMMKALYQLCQTENIPLIVSLEEYMACGVGVCYGCAVKVKNKAGEELYVRVCKEGPVFDASDVVF